MANESALRRVSTTSANPQHVQAVSGAAAADGSSAAPSMAGGNVMVQYTEAELRIERLRRSNPYNSVFDPQAARSELQRDMMVTGRSGLGPAHASAAPVSVLDPAQHLKPSAVVPSSMAKVVQMDVINPATKEVVAQFSVSTKGQVSESIGAAVAAAPAWGAALAADGTCNGAERSRLLNALADALECNKERLIALEAQCSGMPVSQVRCGDFDECVKTFRYFAERAAGVPTIRSGRDGDRGWVTTREPLGAVGVLGVWNYALLMLAWNVAGPLAYGNTVVFKASERATLIALAIERLARDVGFPPGVFTVLTGGPDVGTALVQDEGYARRRLQHIFFTGSEGTAQKVMAAAVPKFIPVSAEMGGKSPHVVYDDALALPGGLDAICSNLMWGIFSFAGQSCSAGSRILVQRGIYEQVKARLIELTAATMVMGDPVDEKTTLGPVIDERQFGHVMGMIDRCKAGIADGSIRGRILCGGEPGPSHGYFIQPTLVELDEPFSTAPIAYDEVFGPVATLQCFDTDEQAIAMANNTRYGLAAGVMTADPARAEQFAAGVQAGLVWEQVYGPTPPAQPFAGWGQSSFGSRNSGPTGAQESEDHYTKSKTRTHPAAFVPTT